MVVGDARDNGEPRAEFEEVAVVFVGFVDEELVALFVIATRSEAEGGADDVGDGEI